MNYKASDTPLVDWHVYGTLSKIEDGPRHPRISMCAMSEQLEGFRFGIMLGLRGEGFRVQGVLTLGLSESCNLNTC